MRTFSVKAKLKLAPNILAWLHFLNRQTIQLSWINKLATLYLVDQYARSKSITILLWCGTWVFINIRVSTSTERKAREGNKAFISKLQVKRFIRKDQTIKLLLYDCQSSFRPVGSIWIESVKSPFCYCGWLKEECWFAGFASLNYCWGTF